MANARSARRTALDRLNKALLADDTAAAESLVATDIFVANLPGASGLNWRQFLMEFARRRTPFSDFGQRVNVLASGEGEGTLFASTTA